MRANHSSDDLAVWTAPDSLATNLAELDDWLVHQYGVNLHEFLAGRRALEGRGGASPTLDPPSLRGQVAKPAPISSPLSSSPVGAERGGFGRPSSPSGPDHRQLKTTFPVSYRIRARQAARIAAVGITSLALWRLISALLRRGN